MIYSPPHSDMTVNRINRRHCRQKCAILCEMKPCEETNSNSLYDFYFLSPPVLSSLSYTEVSIWNYWCSSFLLLFFVHVYLIMWPIEPPCGKNKTLHHNVIRAIRAQCAVKLFSEFTIKPSNLADQIISLIPITNLCVIPSIFIYNLKQKKKQISVQCEKYLKVYSQVFA